MCRSPAGVVDFSTSSRRVLNRRNGQQWTVSRVLFRCAVARAPARIIHLGDTLLCRSSALTRALQPRLRLVGRAALDSASIRACSGRGLPRRRSPGCRAWALTPRFHRCLCLLPGCLSQPGDRGPSAVSFLRRFPSGHPGSPLATSLPCGARTFLPRTVVARRRSSIHLLHVAKPKHPESLPQSAGKAGSCGTLIDSYLVSNEGPSEYQSGVR